jgi:hypothetical protein
MWYQKHKFICQSNFEGASGAMEVEGAKQLFCRSVEKCRMRYLNVVSDGDTKTLPTLQNHFPPIYGQNYEIKKEECINHVAKRMGTALRNLKKNYKPGEMHIGGKGKGKLTDAIISKLQGYYSKAIKENIGTTVSTMKDAVLATFYHTISTDVSPLHSKCPLSATSWCFYNKSRFLGQTPGSHNDNMKTVLNREVAQQIKPVYEKLSDTNLLERCMLGATQNANESLHSIIWTKCPKHRFVGKGVLDIAVFLAVCEFNGGLKIHSTILKRLGLNVGRNTCRVLQSREAVRLKQLVRKYLKQKKQRKPEPAEIEASYSAGAY